MGQENKLKTLMDSREQCMKQTPARQRLAMLFDENSFVELDAFTKANCDGAGVVTGYGRVDGSTVFAFAQDSTENGGAVGRVHGAKIKKVYEMAEKMGSPIVGIYDSNGAALSEGMEALAAYGDMMNLSARLSGVVPQIAVVVGPCAGSAAMVACGADLVVMSKEAEFFMTAPFITEANGEKVPDAGTAEGAAKAGATHITAETAEDAVAAARKLVSLLPLNNLAAVPFVEFEEAAGAEEVLRAACEDAEAGLDIVSVVGKVIDPGSEIELQKEFGEGAYVALATIAGSTVGVVATNKAVSAKLTADDCAKIARAVRFFDAYGIPVITFVDTEGFVASAKAELAGSVRQAAKLAHVYAEATTAKISVVLGEAYGPAYIALAGKNASADITLAWPSAVISALAPETSVVFLWGDKLKDTTDLVADRAALVKEYKETVASPFEAAIDGSIDDVIDPAETRGKLIDTLDMLAGKRVTKLPKKHGNMTL